MSGLFDDGLKFGNGVKRRADGKGDAWANAHRDALGPGFPMNDVDGCFGFVAFGSNTGDRMFIEYVPDDYVNRFNVIREHAVIALFDRKATEELAFSDNNCVSLSLYLYQCRAFSAAQALPCRFFFCIGGQKPPWRMVEVNIETGERINGPDIILKSANWRCIWDALGLIELRSNLRRFLDGAPSGPSWDHPWSPQ
jgi:hypothetical protein